MLQGTRLGFVAETGGFVSIDADTICCLSTSLYLVYILSFSVSLSRYFSLVTSVQQSSAPLKQVRVHLAADFMIVCQ